MTDSDSTAAANAKQAEYWNDLAGPGWVRFHKQLDGQIGALGEIAMDRAELAPGQRVLDIGCGCGGSSLELARRVAPGGTVLGVDLSRPMLDLATARAAREPGIDARFEQGDAQTAAFPAQGFERAFSRFGVMFFADPIAAFANIRRALGTDGRLAFICWRPLAENPWMAIPIETACRFVEPPEPPPPGAPGPFGLADGERTRRILEDAGYGDIAVEPLDETIYVSGPGTPEEAAAHSIGMGPVARLVEAADAATRAQVEAALIDAFAACYDGTGVRMASATWIVTATA
jgi:SAM-dependent methyltransferase